jgi:hypothetical protein
MLPQFLALDVADADKLRVSTKRSATGGPQKATKLLLNMVEGSEPERRETHWLRHKARKG